jgi:CheY-like chemotaxis protein
VFTVTLPLLAEAAEPAGRAAYDPRPEAETDLQRLDAIRVLLVDDDPDTLGAVRAILEDAGATVETAATAAEARSTVSCWKPSVLVSDIAMPEENGYSLVRSLRSSNARLPAIALTAYGRPVDEELAHAAGFEVFLPKPVQRRDLVDAVAALARPQLVH